MYANWEILQESLKYFENIPGTSLDPIALFDEGFCYSLYDK